MPAITRAVLIVITIAGWLLLLWLTYATSAPAPLQRRTRADLHDLDGEWTLNLGGHDWAVTLTRDYKSGGRYRAVGWHGKVWVGTWAGTQWLGVIQIMERPESGGSAEQCFPAVPYGELRVVNGERGEHWRWDYGGRVSLRRK